MGIKKNTHQRFSWTILVQNRKIHLSRKIHYVEFNSTLSSVTQLYIENGVGRMHIRRIRLRCICENWMHAFTNIENSMFNKLGRFRINYFTHSRMTHLHTVIRTHFRKSNLCTFWNRNIYSSHVFMLFGPVVLLPWQML